MTGLKRLDIGGKQRFDPKHCATQLLRCGLKQYGGNVHLEELLLRRSSMKRIPHLAKRLVFFTDLNRGGRRFLQWDPSPAVLGASAIRKDGQARHNKTYNHAALWPFILERVQTIELSMIHDPCWLDCDNEDNGNGSDAGNTVGNGNNAGGNPVLEETDSLRELDPLSYSEEDFDSVGIPKNRYETMRRVSVMYYLLRNGSLFSP